MESVSGPPDMSVPAARAVREIVSPLAPSVVEGRFFVPLQIARVPTRRPHLSARRPKRVSARKCSCRGCICEASPHRPAHPPLMRGAICARKSIGKVYHPCIRDTYTRLSKPRIIWYTVHPWTSVSSVSARTMVSRKRSRNNLERRLALWELQTFSDGEQYVRFEENLRGKHIFLVQSTNSPAENWIRLLLAIDAARGASASEITAVGPVLRATRARIVRRALANRSRHGFLR